MPSRYLVLSPLLLLALRALAPGVYFLRVTQGGREVSARAAVLR